MFPATTERVSMNTAVSANDEIVRQTRERIWQHVSEGAAGIDRRIPELDREWDIERVLEMNAAARRTHQHCGRERRSSGTTVCAQGHRCRGSLSRHALDDVS